jgi:hypothetical protein
VARPQKVAAAYEAPHTPGEDKPSSHAEPLIEHDAKLSEDAAATEVSIPTPSGAVVTPDYKGALVLAQPALVIGRQIEMMNVFLVRFWRAAA